jgi:hypothetical protein
MVVGPPGAYAPVSYLPPLTGLKRTFISGGEPASDHGGSPESLLANGGAGVPARLSAVGTTDSRQVRERLARLDSDFRRNDAEPNHGRNGALVNALA